MIGRFTLNPTVQKCVDAWTSTGDVTQIKTLCTAAQQQIYNDAPYIWLGTVKLVFGGGSVAYNKNVVQSVCLMHYSRRPVQR